MDRAASIALVAASVLALPAAAVAQTTPPAAVRVGGTPNDDMTPIVYAQQTGMFARAGLDVDVERGMGGAAVAAAVAGGSYDIGKSVLSALLDAYEKGIPFRIVAPSSIEDVRHPYGGMLYPRDVSVSSGKDFEGKTIGLADLSSITGISLRAWIDQHGGDGTKLKFLEVPGSAIAAAIEQGRIFAGEANYPNLGAALATGKFNFIPVHGAIARRFIGGAFYTTEAYSAAHPDVIRAFAHVYYAAARYTNAHHDATVQMMSAFTGVSADVIASLPRVESAVDLDFAEIQPVIDLYAKYGLIKERFPASDLIDPNASLR